MRWRSGAHYMLHPHVRPASVASTWRHLNDSLADWLCAEAAAYQLVVSDSSVLTRLMDDCYRLAQTRGPTLRWLRWLPILSLIFGSS